MTVNDIALSREQQRDLHNARCYFENFRDKYADVLGSKVVQDFNRAFESFQQAHDPIREAESLRFDERTEHFDAMARYYNFRSVWSMYDIARLDESLPLEYRDIQQIKYLNQLVPIEKRPEHPWLRWTDVWTAADQAIKWSGDNHHIFIENISKTDEPGVYVLTTGS